ncbi:UDP-N-acetylmuramate--L-alanine ligase [Bacteroidia bacterium]|nr:UDP-N-acetylmuramate--L-alanine ligase [Bacteroidia bacterium]
MYTIDFHKPIHIHFIGIGGVSMSGLAEILLHQGFTVSGSDMKESPLTDKLVDLGVQVSYGQRASNLTAGIDLIVYTAAISKDNPELIAAIEKNIPLLSRAELLGQIMQNYELPIAVSGTHGKTTTTSMISHILLEGGLDPTISVGGILQGIHGNIRVGESEHFIMEACEYTDSFLHFFPKISIILNIEADHLDYFKDIDQIRRSFRLFAEKLPPDGTLIINSDTPRYHAIIEDLPCEVMTYALDNPADYTAVNITYDKKGLPTFDCLKNQKLIGTFSLKVPGRHNVSNALAAIATGQKLGLDTVTIQQGFLSFTGTDRRFQYKGEIGGITVIDDYAHHPTEIIATLSCAKNYPHKTLWCVFQPHTYTRTHALLHDFAEALLLADKVILCDIYAAREKNTIGITSKDLQTCMQNLGKECYYFPSFDQIEKFLLENCIHDDLLITMGAGDVVKIGENLLGQ